MKKALIWIPLLFGLASCGGNSSYSGNASSRADASSSISNLEAVQQLKELLNKQDLSPFISKGLATMFTQEYDVLDVSKDPDEDTRSSHYFSYVGLGFLDSYYELTDEQYKAVADEKGEVNTSDAIASGVGGYRITQSAKSALFYRDGGNASTVQNLDISQQMTLKATEEDVLVYNVLNVTDTQAFDGDLSQNLNASIDKKLLFGSVSTRSFRETFASVNLFDSPGNVEHLDRLYFSICKDLRTKTDEEIGLFIEENQIVLEEAENSIELHFVYPNADTTDDAITDNVFPGAIVGTLLYDKATGSFEEFRYEIKYINEAYDEETGSLRTANMVFSCQGKSTRGAMGDMYVPANPTRYEDVVTFLEDVREQVVPPSIYR